MVDRVAVVPADSVEPDISTMLLQTQTKAHANLELGGEKWLEYPGTKLRAPMPGPSASYQASATDVLPRKLVSCFPISSVVPG